MVGIEVGSLDNNVFEAKLGNLKRIEREVKHILDYHLRSAKIQIERYERESPTDSTTHQAISVRQLKDAEDIVENCNRLNEKWKKVELE